MMTTTTSSTTSELADFMADYAAWLWGCGATCLRLDKNLRRIAGAYGLQVEVSALPRHLTLMLSDGRTLLVAPRRCGANFSLNAELSALSWTIADRRLPLAEARRRFDAIVATPYRAGTSVLLLASLANASFCRLFGGDAAAMLIVLLSTAAGMWLKHALLRRRVDLRLCFLLCALLSTVLSCAAMLWPLTATPQVAVATAVLYLIPGVPYINSASDFLDGHYLCALGRVTDAAVLTAALALGLCIGLRLMNVPSI